ncbi:MAG: hypothetical protein ACI83W_001161, partial [Marinoscillum sp.]
MKNLKIPTSVFRTHRDSITRLVSLLMLMLIFHSYTYAQIAVSGKVTDEEDGEGLPGATVLISSSNTGTITNYEGNFNLKASVGDKLVISFIGYETKEATVPEDGIVNVIMTPDID